MESRTVYLDHASTTPMHPEVIDVMIKVLREQHGNASSLHQAGQAARQVLDESRGTVANLLGVEPKEIIFTGSGTEADNIAIQGVAFKKRKDGKHIITTAIEHPAVLKTCKYLQREHGFSVSEIPVDGEGIVDLDALQAAITPNSTLVSVMAANNEIGTIQPLKTIGEICSDKGIVFHTDAVQAFGKIPIDVDALGVHLLAASAHKLNGPKGVGMLYVKGGGSLKGTGKYIQPIIHGGGHEGGLRPATENVAGIAGMAKAAEIAFSDMAPEMERQTILRDRLIDGITGRIDDVLLNGHRTKRLPNNVNVSIRYVEGESLLMHLDFEGFQISTGSACSSKKLQASHVLLALGLDPEVAHGSLRVTIGRETTEKTVEAFLVTLQEIVARLRKMSPLTPR